MLKVLMHSSIPALHAIDDIAAPAVPVTPAAPAHETAAPGAPGEPPFEEALALAMLLTAALAPARALPRTLAA